MALVPAAVLANIEARRGYNPRRRIPGTNFTYGEVVNKSGASRMPRGRHRLPNGKIVTPWRNAIVHARNLQKLRNAINKERRRRGLRPTGIVINSWWRTWDHNAEVGGARDSQHMYLLATDITREEVGRLCPWKGGRDFFDRTADRLFKNGGFGEYPGGARHVDSRGWRSRWSSFSR